MNDELNTKIEKLEKQQTSTEQKKSDKASDELIKSQEALVALQQQLSEHLEESKLKDKQLEALQQSNTQWETKTKELFMEIQHQELMQEKKEYERNARFNEMAMMV